MENILQWKVTYCTADGCTGHVYLELLGEPTPADIMDSLIQWDTEHRFLMTTPQPDTDRLVNASTFFALNHIENVHIAALDDNLDATSDA